jgi:hypothetical protein
MGVKLDVSYYGSNDRKNVASHDYIVCCKATAVQTSFVTRDK